MFFIVYSIVVMIHEFGHYIVAKKLGYKLDKFYLSPYGVSLNYREKIFSTDDEIMIAVAGPALNIVIAILITCFWWIVPELYTSTADFVSFNFFLAVFNMLPAYPLDGGRVLVSLISKLTGRQKAYKISMLFNVLFSILFFCLFVYSCFVDVNITFALMSVFLILGLIDTKFEGRYERMLFRSRVDLKKGAKVFSIAVSSDITLYSATKKLRETRFNVLHVVFPSGKVKVVNEEVLKTLILLYDSGETLSEIFVKMQ